MGTAQTTQSEHEAGRLAAKVAIVTGAGSVGDGIGTGRATAILFAREGATVALLDNVPDRAKATLGMVEETGATAFVVEADITDEESCRASIGEVAARTGRIDVLVNNVGMVIKDNVVDVSSEDWDRLMVVNVKAMMLMSKFAVPVMVGQGAGAIINVSSIAPRRPNKSTPYAASKAAVEALTRGMAVDHGPDGIRVNCIAPGPLFTPRGASMTHHKNDKRARRRDASPLHIEGTGWDVGWAAVYLASEESRYVTGSVLTVDGGVSIRGIDYH